MQKFYEINKTLYNLSVGIQHNSINRVIIFTY
jgi:hypothetical protein